MNFKTIVASALIAASTLVGATPAEANTPWIYVGESRDGRGYYVRDIINDPHVPGLKYFKDGSDTIRKFNCHTGYGWFGDTSTNEWTPLGYYRPGTMSAREYDVVCRGYRPSAY